MRQVRNRGGAFVDAWVAQRSLVVGPDGDLVQVWITHFPPVARHREGIASAGVDGYGRVEFQRFATLADGCHPGDGAGVLDQLPDHCLFPDLRAFVAGIVKEHLVKLTAQHLPGAGGFVLQVGEKVKGLRRPPVATYELDAVLLGEMRALHPVDKPDTLERKVSIGEQ